MMLLAVYTLHQSISQSKHLRNNKDENTKTNNTNTTNNSSSSSSSSSSIGNKNQGQIKGNIFMSRLRHENQLLKATLSLALVRHTRKAACAMFTLYGVSVTAGAAAHQYV
jgi:hypothetical protein